jgi:hypothetical protein
MRNKISIGIDPGLSGAIAALNAGSLEVLEVMDTPVITSEGKRIYDIGGMADAIRRVSLFGDAVVILEQAQAMPHQGVVSTFATGRGFGIWEGVLSALDVPFRTVRPSGRQCGQGRFWPGRLVKVRHVFWSAVVMRDKSITKHPNPHTELLLLLRNKEREKRGRKAHGTGACRHARPTKYKAAGAPENR